VSLFSTKYYSADNLANNRNLASADDRASADDLEVHYYLASADNLESRQKQTAEPTTNNTNPNDSVHAKRLSSTTKVTRRRPSDFDFKTRVIRRSG
jgi:hypothetical protein